MNATLASCAGDIKLLLVLTGTNRDRDVVGHCCRLFFFSKPSTDEMLRNQSVQHRNPQKSLPPAAEGLLRGWSPHGAPAGGSAVRRGATAQYSPSRGHRKKRKRHLLCECVNGTACRARESV